MPNAKIIFASFVISFFSILVLRLVAYKVKLIDTPNKRKQHDWPVPLIGGISIYITLFISLFLIPTGYASMSKQIIVCISILCLIGAIDDRFDLSYKTRLIIQCCIIFIFIYLTDIKINSLGNLFGLGAIDLGLLSFPITFIVFLCIINAFNMIDGLDGLAGGVSLVGSLFFLAIIGNKSTSVLGFFTFLAVALSVYLCFNLSNNKYKIFLGDAGSTVLGFIFTAYLIRYSQYATDYFYPITALWIISLPIMDLLTTCILRISQGKSPFKADNQHIHHLLQKLGFTKRVTLCILILFSLVMMLIGLGFQLLEIDESIIMLAFITCCAIHIAIVFNIQKVFSYVEPILPKILFNNR